MGATPGSGRGCEISGIRDPSWRKGRGTTKCHGLTGSTNDCVNPNRHPRPHCPGWRSPCLTVTVTFSLLLDRLPPCNFGRVVFHVAPYCINSTCQILVVPRTHLSKLQHHSTRAHPRHLRDRPSTQASTHRVTFRKRLSCGVTINPLQTLAQAIHIPRPPFHITITINFITHSLLSNCPYSPYRHHTTNNDESLLIHTVALLSAPRIQI